MLELLAKVEQAAVPLAFTLTYPDNFPLYRRITKAIWRRSVTGCNGVGREQRLFGSWNSRATIGPEQGQDRAALPLLVFGVPWRFRFKEERGESARLRRVRVHEGGEHWKEEIELDGSRQST